MRTQPNQMAMAAATQPSSGGIMSAQGATTATRATPQATAVLYSSIGGRSRPSRTAWFFMAPPAGHGRPCR